MTDDLLDGVLGGEEEKSEIVPEVTTGAEAFAAAIAAIASRQDPGVAHKTEVFLDKQARLLDLQARHLEDEHASRLRHLRLTVGAAKRKRYADFMRNGLYTCIALLVLGILVAVVRMTFEAMEDRRLLVEDFTVPADFAARGVTSQALAEDLAARVSAIRTEANSHSITQSGEARSDRADVPKVQIPETGLSVDELERFVHRWLGHQTELSGQLRDEPGGRISVVLHIPGVTPIVATGAAMDLDRLMQAAAEKAFAIYDPENNVKYLVATGRPAEAYEAAVQYVQSPAVAAMPPPERTHYYALMAAFDPDPRRALSTDLSAAGFASRDTTFWWGLASLSVHFGHEQSALNFYRQEIRTKQSDVPSGDRGSYPLLMADARAHIDRALGDFAAYQRDEDDVTLTARQSFGDVYAERADTAAALHQLAQSQEQLARALATGSIDAALQEARWYVSSAAGNWPVALSDARSLVQGVEAREPPAPTAPKTNVQQVTAQGLMLQAVYRPWLANSEAMTGDTASAMALISQTPTDCYLCVRTRAKVAAAAGDAAMADHWFAEAVRQAPDLPMAYFEWGQALFARGDLAGAVRELSLAHAKGPHFADPLKAWGDVLIKQHHPKEALAKYDEALHDAPDWHALTVARAAAAGRT
jgi:tetratricopeptide (TPR) repeat protein